MGLEVWTELVNESSLATALGERGVAMVGACASPENGAVLGMWSLPVRRQWNGFVLDRSEKRGEVVRRRMDKTRMSTGELQCKQSLILGKVTEESWKDWGTQ